MITDNKADKTDDDHKRSIFVFKNEEEFITLKSDVVYSIWNGIYIRCYKDKTGSFMCNLWLNNKSSFAEW